MAANAPNVWTQMNYVAPRGQCNFKATMVSSRCPCLRFMLHPLKSSSSYECDGCSHHASFHSMENKEEEEIMKKWELEAKEKAEQERTIARPRKRLREIQYNGGRDVRVIESSVSTQDEHDERDEESVPSAVGPPKSRTRATRGGKSTNTRVAATRAQGRVMEIIDDEDVIDVD